MTFPAWRAVARSASGQELSSVGEALTRRFGDVPSQAYSLRAPAFDGITEVEFSSDPRLNGVPFAAFSAILSSSLHLFRSNEFEAAPSCRATTTSAGDQWSRPDATRNARLARPHTSGARCTKAEAFKPGQETEIQTKDHKTKAPTARPCRPCWHPHGGEAVSRLLLRRRFPLSWHATAVNPT